MSLMSHIERGRSVRPRRIMVYGTHGIGKSTFGAMAERPVFIQTEDGLADIDTERFPLATDFKQVIEILGALYTEEHEYQTVVIDSLDWLERMIHAKTCRDRGVKSIEDVPYAKGYIFALDAWREVLAGLDALRSERGMQVVLIAHAAVEKFANPETETYDRYAPRLNKHASALVQEWSDEVLFATYRVLTKSTDEGFNRKRIQGVGSGERVIKATERPSHVAKNRLGLPDELPLDFRAYAAFRDGESVEPPSEAPTDTNEQITNTADQVTEGA